MLKQAINNPITVLMLMLSFIIFGLISFKNMPVNAFPNIDYPVVMISTFYQGADSKSVESKISSKVEDALSLVDGVDKLYSTSQDGASVVTVYFDLKKDLATALNDVRDKIGKISLPLEANTPIITKFSSGGSVMGIFMSSRNNNEQALMKDANEIVKPLFQSVIGVGSVTISGLRVREIRIFLDSFLLNKYSISASELSRVIADNNINQGGGKLLNSKNELVIKTSSKILNIEDVKNIQIKKGILLKDVALVSDSISDANSFSSKGDDIGVYISINKIAKLNSLAIIEGIKKKLKTLETRYGNEYEFFIINDQSIYILANLHALIFDLIFGSLLAIFIVYVFLRNIPATIIAGLSIPISIIGTFAILDFLGYDLNRLTMLGLILAIGIFIDDSIVVVENISKKIEQKLEPLQASYEGIKEISFSVFAISCVLLAVFVPIAFMEGIIGIYFVSFALSVVSGILISYVIAVVFIPTLSARLLKVKQSEIHKKTESFFIALENKYKNILILSIRHKYKTILLTIVTIILAFVPNVGMEFVPKEDKSEFKIKFKADVGTSLEHTIKLANQFKSYLNKDKDVVEYILSVNSNSGNFFVKLKDANKRVSKQTQKQIINKYRKKLKNIKGLFVTIGRDYAPMEIFLQGDSFVVLDNVSSNIIKEIKKIKGAVDIERNYENTQPQVEITINKAKAMNAGIKASSIAKEISQSFVGGISVSKYIDNGKEYDITMRYANKGRISIDDIKKIQIKNAKGALVFIDNLVNIKQVYGNPVINRYNRQRQIKIDVNLNDKIDLGSLKTQIEQKIKPLMPSGYSYNFSGDAENMKDSFKQFFIAIGLGLILVYLILASLYGSFIQPIIIMISMPLCIAGVTMALFFSGGTFNLFVMIGVILLMGMVGKNAILVVDFANKAISEGYSLDDAISEAGQKRLRPILMTTFAMIGAMIPTAFSTGIGSATNGPMALAVIGGLSASTVLTLLVIPSLYKIMYPIDKYLKSFYELKKI